MKYDDEYKEFICKEFLRVFSGDKIPKDMSYDVSPADVDVTISNFSFCSYVGASYDVTFTIFPVKNQMERLKEENTKLKNELDEIKDAMRKLIK